MVQTTIVVQQPKLIYTPQFFILKHFSTIGMTKLSVTRIKAMCSVLK